MVHSTVRVERLVTTRCGMRRILKEPQHSAVDYIRSAVRSGVYKVEVPDRGRGRGRDGRRGPAPVAFPVEYEILSMNPPLPLPSHVPKNYEKKLRKQQRQEYKLQKKKNQSQQQSQQPQQPHSYYLPTQDLIQSYLERYDERSQQSENVSATDEEEAYMAKLLGIPRAEKKDDKSFTAMARKNTVLSNAYQFALKQYDVLQQNEGMTEEESIQVVEQLLQEQDFKERQQSRQRAKTAQEWRTQKDHYDPPAPTHDSQEPTDDTTTPTDDTQEHTPPVSTVPSILFNKPRTIQAMRIWAQRLKAVPYDQWTVGAATALDHWIAVDVLGMTEQTWNSLFDYDTHTSNNDTNYNISRTRDVVSVRKALFPETLLFSSTTTQQDFDSLYDNNNNDNNNDNTNDQPQQQDDDDLDATERSIDELLASLGGAFHEPNDTNTNTNHDDATFANNDTNQPTDKQQQQDEDLILAQMVDELQDWRRQNQQLPYESWQPQTKKEFNTWLNRYVEVLASEADKLEEVDMDATRIALLAEPPTTRHQSDGFWGKLRDQSEAEVFLQQILLQPSSDNLQTTTTTPTTDTSTTPSQQAFAAFLKLPYNVQLRQLLDIGTLRPILDEYNSESNRSAFIQRYGETLMEGVHVEHLVPDANGPIKGQDLIDGPTAIDTKNIHKDDRFSIQLIPHGTDEYGTPRSQRARALYHAWNTMKTGRARYEELLFKEGKLGLRATSTINKPSDDK